MEKTYKIMKGQSKYAAPWGIVYYDENGNHNFTGFPTKRDLNNAVKNFIEQGYTEQND